MLRHSCADHRSWEFSLCLIESMGEVCLSRCSMKRDIGGRDISSPGLGRYPVVLLIGLGSSMVWLIFISQNGSSPLPIWLALRSDKVTPGSLVLHPFYHFSSHAGSRNAVRNGAEEGRGSLIRKVPGPPARSRSPSAGRGFVIEKAPTTSSDPAARPGWNLLAFLHLAVCLGAIFFSGRILEACWGSARFALFFALATLGSAAFTLALSAALARDVVIFGTGAGAFACLASFSTLQDERTVGRVFSARYLAWAVVFILAAVLAWLDGTGAARLSEEGAGVFMLPQVSGVGFGILFVVLLPSYERWLLERELAQRRAQQRKVHDMRRRVDQLLDKISNEGSRSLSREEREFLEEASKHYGGKV